MSGSAQPEVPLPPRKEASGAPVIGGPPLAPVNGKDSFDVEELNSALQLLVERAQYITGATGAALALAQGEEMVCRASVGVPGPAVGARLQVQSGLTGESIARKQLLRCDNAETDPRVNLETCRQLGIASIVVMPLLSRNGQVRGLFELFSDHPYAFEERDLIALERMGDLTQTAIDLTERKPRAVKAEIVETTPTAPDAALVDSTVLNPPEPEAIQPVISSESSAVVAATATNSAVEEVPEITDKKAAPSETETPTEAAKPPVPEAMRRVQKCSACGFPISEGRELCVDCENKRYGADASDETARLAPVPAFLADSPPPDESWLANHVNLLAVLVLVLSIVVAIVVFR